MSTLDEVLGCSYVLKENRKVPVATYVRECEVVLIYFGASWCSVCWKFTPKLRRIYDRLLSKGRAIEVLWYSLDSDSESFDQYRSRMPWASIPFDAKRSKLGLQSSICKGYAVESIPRVVVLDPLTLSVHTLEGRRAIQCDPRGMKFPWSESKYVGISRRGMIEGASGGVRRGEATRRGRTLSRDHAGYGHSTTDLIDTPIRNRSGNPYGSSSSAHNPTTNNNDNNTLPNYNSYYQHESYSAFNVLGARHANRSNPGLSRTPTQTSYNTFSSPGFSPLSSPPPSPGAHVRNESLHTPSYAYIGLGYPLRMKLKEYHLARVGTGGGAGIGGNESDGSRSRNDIHTALLAGQRGGCDDKGSQGTSTQDFHIDLEPFQSHSPSTRRQHTPLITSIHNDFPELDARITPLLRLAIITSVISAFQVGFNISALNSPVQVIRHDLLNHHIDGDNNNVVQVVSNSSWAWIVAISSLGGLLGAYFGGRFADYKGRRMCILLTNLVMIVGGICQYFSHQVWTMIISRMIIGIASGVITVVIPLYLGEIVPAQRRGHFGAFFQLLLVTGILAANVLAKYMGTYELWRYYLALVPSCSIFQLILFAFLPETPRWLVRQCRFDEASKLLCSLRGHEDVAFQRGVVDSCIPPEPSLKNRFHILYGDQTLWRSLMIALTLQIIQQLSGINAVFYYSTWFFERVNMDDPWLSSVLIAGINVIATLVGVLLVDRMGRRLLLLISLVGMTIACLSLTLSLQMLDTPSFDATEEDVALYGQVAIGSMLLLVFAFELGLGPIPWLITSELFPPQVLSVAITAASTANWLSNFAVGLSFPYISSWLSTWTFLPFGLVCLSGIIFTLLIVPETKGVSFSSTLAGPPPGASRQIQSR